MITGPEPQPPRKGFMGKHHGRIYSWGDGPAGTEHLLVERLAAPFEVGDDKAKVGAQWRRLDAGDELARATQLACSIAKE
jgi:hypothetical protein